MLARDVWGHVLAFADLETVCSCRLLDRATEAVIRERHVPEIYEKTIPQRRPPFEQFRLHITVPAIDSGVADAHLQLVRDSLVTLQIGRTRYRRDEGWGAVCDELQWPDWSEKARRVTDRGIAGLHRLETLYLGSHTGLADRSLAKLTNLRTLDLGANPQITGASVGELWRLEVLHLGRNPNFADASFVRLSRLRVLFLGHPKNLPHVTDAAFVWLPQLEELYLGKNLAITDSAFANSAFHLRVLGLGENKKVTDVGLRAQPELRALYVGSNPNITGDSIARLRELRTLHVGSSSPLLSDECCAALGHLHTLFLGAARLRDTGLRKFAKLEVLALERAEIVTDFGIAGLGNRLRELYLGCRANITNHGLGALLNLRALGLGQNRKISDLGVQKLRRLKYLDLGCNPNVTDMAVRELPELVSLYDGICSRISGLRHLAIARRRSLTGGYVPASRALGPHAAAVS